MKFWFEVVCWRSSKVLDKTTDDDLFELNDVFPSSSAVLSPSSLHPSPFVKTSKHWILLLELLLLPYLFKMSNDADKKVEAEAEGDDDDEDLEKLQAEIKRMEEEAARITKETEELEKKKGDSKATTDTAKASAPAEAPSQDGYDHY